MKPNGRNILTRSGVLLQLQACLWFWLLSPVPAVKAQARGASGDLQLSPNRAIERTLASGETHTYKINLRAGRYFHVEVEQRGIDVLLALVGPGGRVLVERDRPNGRHGAEALSFTAGSAGSYRLYVKAQDEEGQVGKYEVRSDAPHEPTAQDRKRVRAEALSQDAAKAAKTKTTESLQAACEKYEAAATLWRELGDKYAEAIEQTNLGHAREDLEEPEKTIAAHERALSLYRELKDTAGVADSLTHLCLSNALLRDIGTAVAQHGEAKALLQALQDSEGEKELDESFGEVAKFFLQTGYGLIQGQEAQSHLKALKVLDAAWLMYAALEDKPKEALALAALGRIRDDLGEKQKALEFYNQTLTLVRALNDREGEATILSNIGSVYDDLGQKQQALDYYNQALPLKRAADDKPGEAATLNNIGLVYKATGEGQKALEYYNQALTLMRGAGDRAGEATTLNNIGAVYSAMGENQKALDYYNQALKLARDVGNRSVEATTLSNIGLVYSSTGEKQKALDYYNQALSLSAASSDGSGKARTLNNIGSVYDDLDDKLKALEYYNQALSVSRAAGDKSSEAATLNNLGLVYGSTGERRKALDYYSQALTLMRDASDRPGEAATLNNLGGAYSALGEKPKALGYFNQALALMQAVADRPGEARTLGNIGIVYDDLDDKLKALEYYDRSLLLARAAGDKSGEAAVLSSLGLTHSSLGEKQKALDYFGQARSLYAGVGDKSGEASTLNNFGSLYHSMGEKRDSLDYYNQALKLLRDVGDRTGEATTLNNIGLVYSSTGENQKALDYYNQALPLRRAVGDRAGEATTLNNLGLVYGSMGESQKALDHYTQALKLMRDVSDRSGEANTLSNLGTVYSLAGEDQKALDYYGQALPLVQAIGDTLGKAVTFNNMMLACQALKNPRLAVFYGKQSVNSYQQFRGTSQELKDKELQKSFLKSVEISYRSLARLLIAQGRFAEAVQVLNTFKDQQYFDFDVRAIKKPSPLDMTRREGDFASRYDATSAKAGQAAIRLEELKETTGARTQSAAEAARFLQLEADLQVATDGFRAVVRQAETEFGGAPDVLKDKPPDIEDTQKMQAALGDLKTQAHQKAVAVYTLVGENDFWALIITPKDIIPVNSLVKGRELNRTARTFSAQLGGFNKETNTPKFSRAEVQKTGKELYDLVFAPVAAKLKELNIRPDLLMWSLDGGLRYVPVAALYDGEHYLAERFRNVVFTRADAQRLLSHVSRAWTGLGVYNSKGHSVPVMGKMENFPGLRNARSEVEAIFGVPPGRGIIGGEFLPDQTFTRASLLEKLRLHYPLVHIASHFRLVPGDASSSFLLLGDGSKLTLADIRNEPDSLFGDVELLTLSACETGLQKENESDGREIDSFAELAQRKGAQAILSSLWSVDDKSTSRLMTEFYQTRQLKKLTKAEALQKAQLSLLKEDRYSHPYYWSPFILIGNWH